EACDRLSGECLRLPDSGVALRVTRLEPEGDECKSDQAEDDRPAACDGCAAPVAPPFALLLSARAPVEDRIGEGVVVDLVARLSYRPENPNVAGRELVEHRRDLGLRPVHVLGQVAGALRDLRSRRRDELVEEARREVLLLR